jgi:hypothetical protein
MQSGFLVFHQCLYCQRANLHFPLYGVSPPLPLENETALPLNFCHGSRN